MGNCLSGEKQTELFEAAVLGERRGTVKKSCKSIYVLVIQVGDDINVNVGAFGERTFAKGLYAYVGSARTNIEQRIKRHLRGEKRKFWHIDYLLDNATAKIIKVFFREGDKAEECKTAESLSSKSEPVKDFGCSDSAGRSGSTRRTHAAPPQECGGGRRGVREGLRGSFRDPQRRGQPCMDTVKAVTLLHGGSQ